MSKSWKYLLIVGLSIVLFTSCFSVSFAGEISFGQRALTYGISGDDVKILQTLLKEEGYYAGKISSFFDQATSQAVKNYQKKQGLQADGVVGKQTYNLLLQLKTTNYTVGAKDTLEGLAEKYASSPAQIKQLNGLKVNQLTPGQKILLPVKNYEGLRNELLNLTRGKEGVYGVYLKDINTGQILQINGEKPFVAASTYKVPLNLYLYEKIISGVIDPNTKIHYQNTDYETGTGILQSKAIGSQFSVKDLSELSITVSDNVAKNMLERYLGGRDDVINYMASLGGKTLPNGEQKRLTSPRDMSLYMEKLLEMNQKNPQIMKNLLNDLEHTIFNDRINALLPANIPVAHKIGNQINVLNDTGIVFHPQNPYILTIMSDKINYGEAYPTIQTMAKKIYDFQNARK